MHCFAGIYRYILVDPGAVKVWPSFSLLWRLFVCAKFVCIIARRMLQHHSLIYKVIYVLFHDVITFCVLEHMIIVDYSFFTYILFK